MNPVSTQKTAKTHITFETETAVQPISETRKVSGF